MRINHNLMSMNTHRQLGLSSSRGARSMSKLSSGYRINGAADDAAGLSISEKMRAQIRGLGQASRNAQDGISLIQTAEGALNETHSILQRMRELAVQSATDTNTDVDRSEIQKEIDELASEVSRIADTTEFNTQSLLDGNFTGIFHIGANEGQNIALSINAMDAETLGISSAEGVSAEVTTAAVNASATGTDDTGAVTADTTYSVVSFDEVTVGTIDAQYGMADADGNIVAVSADGDAYTAITAATAEADLGTATLATGVFDFGASVISGDVTVSALTGAVGSETVTATATGTVDFGTSSLSSGSYTVVDTDHALIDAGLGLLDSNDNLVAVSADGTTWTDMQGDSLFTLPGTNAFVVDDTVTVSGQGGIDVSTQTAASGAITTINDALVSVSTERAKMGASQNRLEHTIRNLDTSAENLQASESRIRDVDMAKEMMEYTKQNILQQAATAMLAQANQAPQAVLQLLQ